MRPAGSPIASGSSAPSITLNVAVAGNAPSSLTNTATVANGNDNVPGNNSDSDPTTVDNVDVGIVKSHIGDFNTGTGGTWELAVTSSGTVATVGTTTVSDTLPSGISFVSADAPAEWTCGAVGQQVTCTRIAGLASGATETIDLNVTRRHHRRAVGDQHRHRHDDG